MVATVQNEFRYVDEEKDVAACFALMRQLRARLALPQEFVERWRRRFSQPADRQ